MKVPPMPTVKNTPTRSKAQQDKVESLEAIIVEQKQDYEYLLHIYNRMRATEGLLLTATFGVVAYLYSTLQDGHRGNILDRLSFPPQPYGQIIYVFALGFFAYGTYELMSKVFGKNFWMTAYESAKDNYSFKYLETLEYIKRRYDECAAHNQKRYFERKDGLSSLFYRILVSAIILIVIKTLG